MTAVPLSRGDATATLVRRLVEAVAAQTGQDPVWIARRLGYRGAILGSGRIGGGWPLQRADELGLTLLTPVDDPLEEVAGQGEGLAISERVIVAPMLGRFRPLPAEFRALTGGSVEAGQPIGFVDGFRVSNTIHSPFTGQFAGMLVLPGEHLHKGQPVAWLRTP